MVRRRVVVHGHVQGVFFRATCESRAREAGVAGWVANQGDGTVEAVFEGEAEPVGRLVDWCRSGPDGARVERVEVAEEEPRGETGFATR